MDLPIEIIEKDSENTLEVSARIPTWKMPVVILKAYKDIEKYLKKNKSAPSGPAYVRYLSIDLRGIKKKNLIIGFIQMFTKKWNMIIGYPVKDELKGNRKIKPGVFPGGKYVKTMHQGPYQKIGNTYIKMLEYFNENNIKFKKESAEIYLNDPERTNEEDLETIVMIPISE